MNEIDMNITRVENLEASIKSIENCTSLLQDLNHIETLKLSNEQLIRVRKLREVIR
jgi:hypothetical protein